MATHVLVGKEIDGAFDDIAHAAKDGSTLTWTVPRAALINDDVYFYILNPLGSFVARGRLSSDKWPGYSDEGKGEYLAEVSGITMLTTPTKRLEMAAAAPGWGWPRQPHTATTIPEDQVAVVRRALN